jgi:hypothetical protein
VADRLNTFTHDSAVGDIVFIDGEKYRVICAINTDPADIPMDIPLDANGNFDLSGFKIIHNSERSSVRSDKSLKSACT